MEVRLSQVVGNSGLMCRVSPILGIRSLITDSFHFIFSATPVCGRWREMGQLSSGPFRLVLLLPVGP